MKHWAVITFLSLTLTWPLLGQEEASMSSPVLQATPEAIHVTARFENFLSGARYRLGVGTAGDTLSDVTLELLKGESPLSKELESFQQGYAQSWFEVNEISVQGFRLSSSDFPAQGEPLILKVTVPRAEAERVQKFFIILAKHYDPDRWYIIEGAELTDSLW